MKKIEYNRGRISPAKEIAAVAVMCALLIGGQLALSFVSGVEVVTVLLLSFSFTYGRRAGALTAISFSLLRCFIAGFVPNVIVLYLIYYTVFALTFGALGSVKREVYENFPVWAAVIVNFVIALLAIGCGLCAATNFLKISRLSVVMVKTLLWIIFGLSCAMLVVFNTVFVMQKRVFRTALPQRKSAPFSTHSRFFRLVLEFGVLADGTPDDGSLLETVFARRLRDLGGIYAVEAGAAEARTVAAGKHTGVIDIEIPDGIRAEQRCRLGYVARTRSLVPLFGSVRSAQGREFLPDVLAVRRQLRNRL